MDNKYIELVDEVSNVQAALRALADFFAYSDKDTVDIDSLGLWYILRCLEEKLKQATDIQQ